MIVDHTLIFSGENYFYFTRNDGTCIEINSTVSNNNGSMFYCECQDGYQGRICQLRIDLCVNITCENRGVCATIDMTWKCTCLDPGLFYGNRCEFQTGALLMKKALSRSFASVAISAITITCSFILLMDALKYIFHIDPAKFERQKLRQRRQQEKEKAKSDKPKPAVRFQYIP